jgi:hypothetical protein
MQKSHVRDAADTDKSGYPSSFPDLDAAENVLTLNERNCTASHHLPLNSQPILAFSPKDINPQSTGLGNRRAHSLPTQSLVLACALLSRVTARVGVSPGRRFTELVPGSVLLLQTADK